MSRYTSARLAVVVEVYLDCEPIDGPWEADMLDCIYVGLKDVHRAKGEPPQPTLPPGTLSDVDWLREDIDAIGGHELLFGRDDFPPIFLIGWKVLIHGRMWADTWNDETDTSFEVEDIRLLAPLGTGRNRPPGVGWLLFYSGSLGADPS
jgi:hypothetical protein